MRLEARSRNPRPRNPRRRNPLPGLCAVFLTTAVGLADAADRYVDGNTGSDAANSCTSSADPCASIGRAVSVASVGDTVRVADSTYTEILTVDKTLSIRGESRGGTIIQAAADRLQAAGRVISLSGGTGLEISDVTIRHGNASLNGGGLESNGGDLLIERVLFTRNDAAELGGALFSGNNVVVMNDVVFRKNGSSNTREGGGAFLGENFVLTDATLSNVAFESNTAGSGGGGLSLFNAQAVFRDVAFVGNTSSGDGGGLFYEGSNSVSSSLELRDVRFVGNSAADGGGGMYSVTDDTPYSMINVLFSGNLANLGGALFNQAGLAGSSRVLTNVTMSGNRAQLRGGAIDRPLAMIFRNTVIWNNSDSSGTGTAEATMDDFFSNSVVEVSNSLLQGYPASEFPGSNNLDGTDPGSNPLFRDAVNPAGAPSLAGNLRLQQDSPIRDRGNNAFVVGVDTDLDGEVRIFGGTVDLGAFEGTDLIFADGFEDSGF